MGDHRVRFGLQFATVPISSGPRSGYGWEIGPRCGGSEIAREMWRRRRTGKAVWETRRPFSFVLTSPLDGLKRSSLAIQFGSTHPSIGLAMLRTISLLCLVLIGLTWQATTASAEKRVALIVGNAGYQNV